MQNNCDKYRDLKSLIYNGLIHPFYFNQKFNDVFRIVKSFDPDGETWNETWVHGERMPAGWFDLGEIDLLMGGESVDFLFLRAIIFEPGMEFIEETTVRYKKRHLCGGLKVGMSIDAAKEILKSVGICEFEENWFGEEKETLWFNIKKGVNVFFSLDEDTGKHYFTRIEAKSDWKICPQKS